MYALAKAAQWDHVLVALAGERELGAACSRYTKPTSGWTFLHQAAYSGSEVAARLFIRLGASLSARSKEGDTARDIAAKRRHTALSKLLADAADGADLLWEPSTQADLLPSSGAWTARRPRVAWRDLRVGYGGGCVDIPAGSRYFVDSFERVLVGWHGSYDPPRGMDGEPMF